MGLSSAQPTTMALGLAHQEVPSQSKDPVLFTKPEMEEVDYESLPTDRLSAHLLAGGAAGMMEHCFMYPVDCVKVRGKLSHATTVGQNHKPQHYTLADQVIQNKSHLMWFFVGLWILILL